MLFPIILSFFGFAYGLQYYPRYAGYVSGLAGGGGGYGGAPAFNRGGSTIQNFDDLVNSGLFVSGRGPINPAGLRLVYNPEYRTLQYVPNRSLYSQYLPYNPNVFYGGFNGRYTPRYQQNIDYPVPASAAFINTGSRYAFAPDVQNVAAIQAPVATVQSVQDAQGVAQNQNRLLNIDQQVGHVQVPANVEVRGQGVVQPVGEVNNVPQQVGLVQNVVHPVGVVPNIAVPEFRAQPVGVVSNSYQPIIGTLSTSNPFLPVVKFFFDAITGVVFPILNIVPKSEFLITNVQTIPESGQSLNPQIITPGYSQQLPAVAVPYVRNIEAPVASNVGIGSQITGFRTDNGFVSSGLVGALAAGGRSTVVQK